MKTARPAPALLVAGLLLVVAPAFAQPAYPPPERTVQGHVLRSAHDPKVQLSLPASAHYVGASRWVLYGMADCELHAFVEADAHKRVQRIYWVQFEGYLPSRPELHHAYDSPRHATLGGLDFYVDTWVEPSNAAEKAGSDGEHIKALIRTHGYTLPAAMMSVRLVHLLDASKRRELMLIYSEDTGATGFDAADLNKGGRAYSRWPAIEHGLIERAQQRISLSANP
jgi:hypothetical protein